MALVPSRAGTSMATPTMTKAPLLPTTDHRGGGSGLDRKARITAGAIRAGASGRLVSDRDGHPGPARARPVGPGGRVHGVRAGIALLPDHDRLGLDAGADRSADLIAVGSLGLPAYRGRF